MQIIRVSLKPTLARESYFLEGLSVHLEARRCFVLRNRVRKGLLLLLFLLMFFRSLTAEIHLIEVISAHLSRYWIDVDHR